MSLEYYLLCREKYEYILKYLQGINKLYNEIIDITYSSQLSFEELNYNIFLPEYNNEIFVYRKNHIEQLKKICDNKIYELCIHSFIEDSIDITPDNSENIIYCKICGFTK